MTIDLTKTQEKPVIIRSKPCKPASDDFLSQLLRETWYFSNNFDEIPREIGSELKYNKRVWKVINSRKTLQGWAYQLEFVRKLSETELQSVVSNIKENSNEF